MAPLAELCIQKGFNVSGSDQEMSAEVDRLRSLGASIQTQTQGLQGLHPDLIIYSSAINEKNLVMKEALQQKIPVIKRAKLLGDLMRTHYSLAVSGTHGKSTTTAMLAEIFVHCGEDPSLVLGAQLQSNGSGARNGRSNYLIVEADEYDQSFLSMWPSIAIITNIEAEHLDSYGSLAALEGAFVEFINRVPCHGLALLNLDDDACRKIEKQITAPYKSYALTESADYQAREVRLEVSGCRYEFWHLDKPVCEVELILSGIHNVSNSLAAMAVASEQGLDLSKAAEALKDFKGARRRFEKIGEHAGITVYEDYAHHPTELDAVVKAALQKKPQRLLMIFQPHLFSRTRIFYREIASAMKAVSRVWVCDIYASREEPIVGVDSSMIRDAAKKMGIESVEYGGSLEQCMQLLLQELHEGDMVLLVGAGSIGGKGTMILEAVGTKK